jgi:hypothetical protein
VAAKTRTEKRSGIDDHSLTLRLAQAVMGWRLAPGRFLKPDRGWLPKWRFQPAIRLDDAFQLLEQSAPDDFEMKPGNRGSFRVQVRLGGKIGMAEDVSKPRAITYAVARALNLDIDGAGGTGDADEI